MIFLGFDPLKTIQTIKALPSYLYNLVSFKRQSKKTKLIFRFGKLYPCLSDKYSQSGCASGHYFHQDLLVARKVFFDNPERHVDVGSRIDGFVAHVASFRKIEVFDIRELQTRITNIRFTRADLMSDIDESLIDYCDSLSCLHTLEHFGLGRYGDPINFEGYITGLNNMHKILKKKGKFYLSVPIGPQRIEFNAHRVFSLKHLLELFKNKFEINSFSYIDDKGDLHENVELTNNHIDTNFNCNFGCGIFDLTKL